MNNIFIDNAAKREVLSLTVECTNNIYKCEWKGELRELNASIFFYIIKNFIKILLAAGHGFKVFFRVILLLDNDQVLSLYFCSFIN